MNIALIGYGKMGRAIGQLAGGHGHTVAAVIDNDSDWSRMTENLLHCDVALEFTQPDAAAANIMRCLEMRLPVVCGTTGWYEQLEAVKRQCSGPGRALFVASNFSIGMNIVFELNRRLAHLMACRPEYRTAITETHHIHKLDAPSGTAVTLAQDINRCCLCERIPLASIVSRREGEVAGIHEVVYDSAADTITLRHEAKGREGLASGALMAAEFLHGREGYYTMQDLLNESPTR